jgi:peroxiredoxin
MRRDLVPGGVFPGYELPDHTNTLRKLSELQGEDPLILTLARDHYCPKEHQQHLELAAFYPKIAVAYTQVATISTDDHHTLQEFRVSFQRPLHMEAKQSPQSVHEEQILAALDAHWRASAAGDADVEHDICADDAICDYPQSGERILGEEICRPCGATILESLPASR